MMRIVGWAALAGALLAAACGQTTRTETAEELVARGQHLVETTVLCNDCHTPMTAEGPDLAQALQGADLIFEPTIPIPWAPKAPPLAGLPDGYTEEQFIHFLQTGERPDGSHPLPPMPPFRLDQDNARAVAAYVHSLTRNAPAASAPAPADAAPH